MKAGKYCAVSVLALVSISAIMGPLAWADEVQDLKKENVELRQRVDKLAGELDTIKALLQERGLPVPPPSQGAALRPVSAKFDIQLYGYIKLDASFDDSRVNAGNFARWVETESVLANDAQFNMTANQTRLGMDITMPATDKIKSSGKVEIDFYGAGAGENKPDPMLRHAYLNVEWPELRFSVLAGQTSDIISPLVPNTVNYSVGWWQGNVGYRRPQIRLTKSIGLAENVDLKLEGGISRTITGRRVVFKEATDPDTGADAGFPTVAARASLSFPVGEKRQATVGISGYYGGEEVHATNLVSATDYKTWSANIDLKLPLTGWLLLQAEGFIGENMDSHLGGIGQGINTALGTEISTIGGWAAITLTPDKAWQFNFGGGFDNPDNRDLTGSTTPGSDARTANYFVFGNCFYSFTANLQVALEVSYLRTTYRTLDDGDALRQQLAFILKF